MEVKILETSGLVPAMQALRLPYSRPPRSIAVSLSDTDGKITKDEDIYMIEHNCGDGINEEDLALAQKLIKSGDAHSKVMRGVIAYLEISAPRYFWQEFVTHRIGCECLSSESTVHTITKGVTANMFDCDEDRAVTLMHRIQKLVIEYDMAKDKADKADMDRIFLDIKKELPECFIQKRIYAISYQTLRRMVQLRSNHRLPEWRIFLDTIKQLPFAEQLIFVEK